MESQTVYLRPARTDDLERMDQIATRSATSWNKENFARFLEDSLGSAIVVAELKTCPRCEGDGEAHGSDRPFEYHGPWTYPGPCPVCKGESHVSVALGYLLYVDRRTHWYICELVVDPDRRRQGRARQMLEGMARLLDNDHRFLSLDVKASNPIALNLYTVFGFQKVGVVKHLYGPDGDAIRMVYRRPAPSNFANSSACR